MWLFYFISSHGTTRATIFCVVLKLHERVGHAPGPGCDTEMLTRYLFAVANLVVVFVDAAT